MCSTKYSIMLAIVLFGCVLVGAPAAMAGDSLATGRDLYMQHCAVCHGTRADGHGPLRHELSTPPADLRRLSTKYGHPLDEDQIARFMDGRAEIKAHGSRDMPVWGEEMWQHPAGTANSNHASDSVGEIVHYLQSIQIGGQRKPH